MYTLFNNAHTTGSTVMRALAWEFPREPQLAGVEYGNFHYKVLLGIDV
jgi:alpha-glucosidase